MAPPTLSTLENSHRRWRFEEDEVVDAVAASSMEKAGSEEVETKEAARAKEENEG